MTDYAGFRVHGDCGARVMLLTEEEAGRTWCFKARDQNGNRSAYGGDGETIDQQYIAEMAARFPCIASGCAAWRWSRAPEKRPRGIIETDAMARQVHRDIPTECNPRVVGDEIVADGIGYCGLAGKPESI